jgi:hypothetical protein
MTLCKCCIIKDYYYYYDDDNDYDNEKPLICKCELCKLNLITYNYFIFDYITLFLINNSKIIYYLYNFIVKIYITILVLIMLHIKNIINLYNIFFHSIITSVSSITTFIILLGFSLYFFDFYLKKYRINM